MEQATVTLQPGQHIDIDCAGRTIRLSVGYNPNGGDFVSLAGIDCNLEGEEPGVYYPTVLTEPQAD